LATPRARLREEVSPRSKGRKCHPLKGQPL
jgi:hypothetical protein